MADPETPRSDKDSSPAEIANRQNTRAEPLVAQTTADGAFSPAGGPDTRSAEEGQDYEPGGMIGEGQEAAHAPQSQRGDVERP